jgi:hypothetical protein
MGFFILGALDLKAYYGFNGRAAGSFFMCEDLMRKK